MPTTRDPFDAAYDEGISSRPAAPRRPRSTQREVIERRETAAASSEAIALRGLVLHPDGARDEWVVVANGVVADVKTRKPTDAKPIQTDGVILPGMIDLHGHPEYNVFAAWEPPALYTNRGRWRGSKEYKALIKDPWNSITAGGTGRANKAAMARFAEIRALVGGVTAIQGAGKYYPQDAEALVRNVDLYVFGQQIARSTIDLDRLAPDRVADLKDAIAAGTVKAHYLHLAEGVTGDRASITEYEHLLSSGLLSSATVVIHGTALSAIQLGAIADAGAKLVWSPQSNLRLYGQTTNIAAALDSKLPIGLGADWLPSGSRSLLDEMRVARRSLAEQGVPQTAQWLVSAVTDRAAAIAGLGEHLGTIEKGRPADLTVLQRLNDDGYESVLMSEPSDVDAVIIGGDIVYGSHSFVTQVFPDTPTYQEVWAWGRRMLLDTSYVMSSSGATVELPTLDQIRARLIAAYPQIGPIFA